MGGYPFNIVRILRLVTSYHWLREFSTQGGYRLPPVTETSDSNLFSVSTSLPNLSIKTVYHRLLIYRVRSSDKIRGNHWLPACPILADIGYRRLP